MVLIIVYINGTLRASYINTTSTNDIFYQIISFYLFILMKFGGTPGECHRLTVGPGGETMRLCTEKNILEGDKPLCATKASWT